jgi:hypothetical protein
MMVPCTRSGVLFMRVLHEPIFFKSKEKDAGTMITSLRFRSVRVAQGWVSGHGASAEHAKTG